MSIAASAPVDLASSSVESAVVWSGGKGAWRWWKEGMMLWTHVQGVRGHPGRCLGLGSEQRSRFGTATIKNYSPYGLTAEWVPGTVPKGFWALTDSVLTMTLWRGCCHMPAVQGGTCFSHEEQA